ncbi:MAG: hypothetical protein Kow0062_27130 [Acidobacteriota bacterium]|nr:MAG: mechanosensitive ion channel [Acidobacteriota bacterium]
MSLTDLLATEPGRLAARALAGLAVFAVFLLASAVVRAALRRLAEATDADRGQVLRLAGRATGATLVLVGLVSGLGTAGVDVGALIAGLGLTGFAIGFALRDALSNLLAGALILFYRPFRPDDRIKVAGFDGRVREIDLRYTVLEAEDRSVLIPNSMLFTNPITVDVSARRVS